MGRMRQPARKSKSRDPVTRAEYIANISVVHSSLVHSKASETQTPDLVRKHHITSLGSARECRVRVELIPDRIMHIDIDIDIRDMIALILPHVGENWL